MMSLEEAIKHCKQKAIDLDNKSKRLWCEKDIKRCKECSDEYKQLAIWLEELRDRRKADE